MESSRTSPREVPPGVNEIPMLPELSGIDALPVIDAHPISEHRPNPRFRTSRRQSSHSHLLMELLSRRLSRQSLRQQHQSRTTSNPSSLAYESGTSIPFSATYKPPPTVPTNATSDYQLHHGDSQSMEIDADENVESDFPVSTPHAPSVPSHSYQGLRQTELESTETNMDVSVADRVMARLQNNTHTNSAIPMSPSLADSSIIEIDPAAKADMDLEADEGFDETDDGYAWVEKQDPSGPSLSSVLRTQGLLKYKTSSEAAMRCPKLVRNVPRMRKRQHKKKEHRLRAANESTDMSGQSLE